MKTILDPQIFLTQKFGGISRLFVEVWKHSITHQEVTFECPLVYSENYHLNESGLAPKNIFNVMHDWNFKGIGRVKDVLKARSISKTKERLKEQKYNVFLPTYYDPYFLDSIGTKPFILTVYDMIHELYPEYFTTDTKTTSQKRTLIEKADKIVAISVQTKKDILKFYPHIPASKIEVVYLSQSITETSESVELPARYILFVGNRGGYKNFKLFAETVTPFIKQDPHLFIVCAGGGNLLNNEVELLDQLGIGEKVVQKNYKDSELASFYKQAKMFVFPSAYEGFGIPTLEAMQCGCPVILADSSCLPEVGGDAALYFKSDNSSSLAEAIGRVLNDDALRAELIYKGLKRVGDFSWEKTAEGYFNVIKKFA